MGFSLVLATLAFCLPSVDGQARGQGKAADLDDGSFAVTKPIACKEIHGYEDYVVLPRAALTSDEKLMVYFMPRHYKSDRVGDKFSVHFTQDGRIRRRGEKAVLWSKNKLLEYEATTDRPPSQIFFRNTLGIKSLKPGEYDFDIILRDEVGKSEPAIRTLPFTVIAAPPPAKEKAEEKDDEPERPR